MANILVLLERPNERALKSIFTKLEENNHTLDYLYCSGGNIFAESIELAKPIVEPTILHYQNNNYDFGIICTHNGNPGVILFQQAIRPKYGYFDIEHDLLSGTIERSPINQSLGTFAFHKKHTNILKSENRIFFEAEWYKSDLYDDIYKIDNGSLDNCFVVDTSLYNHSCPFPYSDLFTNSYLKGWSSLNTNTPLTKNLNQEKQYFDTQSLFDIVQKAYFGFSCLSGAIIELLLIDRIPILFQTPYSNEEKITDVVSRITISAPVTDTIIKSDYVVGTKLVGITTNNLDYKINQLRNSVERRAETLKLLQQDWKFECKVPKVADILISEINKYIGDN